MQKIWILIVVVLVGCYNKKSVNDDSFVWESEAFEPDYKDLHKLDSVLNIYQNMKTAEIKKENEIDLGFGYSITESGFGFNKIGLNILFLIDQTRSIISAKFELIVSTESNIPQQFKDSLLFRDFFINDEGQLVKYENYINSVTFIDSTIKYKKNAIIDTLISPWSGIIYGHYGGYGGLELKNRAKFNKLGFLNDSTIEVLLNSINPATRLMTVEFLSNNYEYFKNQDDLISNARKSIQQPSTVYTLDGDIQSRNFPIELLYKYCTNSSLLEKF